MHYVALYLQQGSHLLVQINFNSAYISKHMQVKCGMKFFIYFQTSTAVLFKFGMDS